jgi:hypothetical protein
MEVSALIILLSAALFIGASLAWWEVMRDKQRSTRPIGRDAGGGASNGHDRSDDGRAKDLAGDCASDGGGD